MADESGNGHGGRRTILCPRCHGRGRVVARYAKKLHALDLRPQRVEFLRKRLSDLVRWRGRKKDPRARLIVEEMRSHGLIAESTYWWDVNLDKLIEDARRT